MVEFSNISLAFDDKKIFENFNLNILKGEKVLLSAPSGSGKSSLFKLLLGFLKPDQGIIQFKGKKLNKNTVREIRNSISYVSQDIEFRDEKVVSLMKEIFLYHHNKNKDLNHKRIEDLLTYFHLNKNILEKKIGELSGGERQRLGLITAILLDREVWLLDEVTSALDHELKQKVVDYITQNDKTVLVISHDDIWKETSVFKIVRWS
ncbi:MAG: ATP-binding cassette domain-containing protein [Firmicutes bacterium]|nr:ATP-binding cassette domain-containing protein [Bacillota bacterium]